METGLSLFLQLPWKYTIHPKKKTNTLDSEKYKAINWLRNIGTAEECNFPKGQPVDFRLDLWFFTQEIIFSVANDERKLWLKVKTSCFPLFDTFYIWNITAYPVTMDIVVIFDSVWNWTKEP